MSEDSFLPGRVRWRTIGVMLAIALALVAVQIVLDLREGRRASIEEAGREVSLLTTTTPVFHGRDLLLDLRAPSSGEPTPDDSSWGWRPFSSVAGFSGFESWGVWTTGSVAALDVVLLDGSQRMFFVEAMPYKGVLARWGEQALEVAVNGTPCGRTLMRRQMSSYRFTVPDGILHSGVNRVTLRAAHDVSPRELGEGKDPRSLAVGVRRLALVRAAEGVSDIGDLDWSEPLILDHDADQLVVRRAGRVILPLPPGPPPGEVRFRYRFRSSSSKDGFRARVEEADFVGESEDVTTVAAAERRRGAARLTVAEDASLPALVLDVDLEEPDAAVVIRSPSLVGTSTEPAAVTDESSPTPRSAGDAPPDVVMIILDAARADHFGRTYGYSRDTTPSLDRVADASLIFRNAFALAPYTLCSVPTMLSGTSWRVHGVVRRGLRLSDHVVTLAESLRQAGYRTLGFSASPNNSPAIGTDQGYDEFHELWKLYRPLTAINPFRLSRMVVDRLEDGAVDGPLHLMLHYVPPHAPYTPAPRYDVFTDPGYRGPVDGTDRVVGAILAGDLEPGARDRQQLVDLYDGNLRMADAAVEMVLGELRRIGRWRNTLLVVTADHGEAFFEHGQLGHNTTVYDEMLHVPLIVKLPEGARADGVNLDRLAGLDDLVPTILGVVGIEPDASTTGLDLLAARGASEAPPRRLVLRSAETGLRALRGSRWKTILGPGGSSQELYEVSSDPDETRDLALSEAVRAAILASRLRAELTRLETIPPVETGDVLSAEDEEALRALGYVE